MGDVIEKIEVKSIKKKKGKVYFDSGSPYTFISKSSANKIGGIINLPKKNYFEGLGNGKFSSTSAVHLEFNLLGIWCRHFAYIVDDEITGEDTDVLAGHDFTQKYDIKLDLKKRKIMLNRASLKRAQVVR